MSVACRCQCHPGGRHGAARCGAARSREPGAGSREHRRAGRSLRRSTRRAGPSACLTQRDSTPCPYAAGTTSFVGERHPCTASVRGDSRRRGALDVSTGRGERARLARASATDLVARSGRRPRAGPDVDGRVDVCCPRGAGAVKEETWHHQAGDGPVAERLAGAPASLAHATGARSPVPGTRTKVASPATTTASARAAVARPVAPPAGEAHARAAPARAPRARARPGRARAPPNNVAAPRAPARAG